MALISPWGFSRVTCWQKSLDTVTGQGDKDYPYSTNLNSSPQGQIGMHMLNQVEYKPACVQGTNRAGFPALTVAGKAGVLRPDDQRGVSLPQPTPKEAFTCAVPS